MAELQTIPARHGVATFVPAGQTIKIVNTSGTQVVDTWAFALPKPEVKGDPEDKGKDDKNETEKKDTPKKPVPTPKRAGNKKKNDLPSQEEAEAATKEAVAKDGGEAEKADANGTPQKSTWGSYVPSVSSLGLGGKKKDDSQDPKTETEQQKNSRTWASYFPSGQGFSSYIPKSASNTVSQLGSMHQRDPSKSYLEQLQDFSKTPVGAVGMKGMAAVTGSGYSGSLLAGYQAWNATNAKDQPAMEFMSMAHSRAATLHLVPKVNDTMVTNLREPILTLVEDTSPGVHDTLIAACDPQRYKGLKVEKWEEHDSCAANLVLALKELNERAGLKGAKGVGADVTINSVPAPLNLFMNIPWDDDGDIDFKAPKSKAGDYVRFKAERDVVVVMSACPQDVLDINGKNPTDAAFVVEDGEDTTKAIKRTVPPKKKPAPKKLPASRSQSMAGAEDDTKSTISSVSAARRKPVPPTVQPQRKPAASTANSTGPTPAPPAKKSPPATKPPAPKKTANSESAAPAERKKPRKLPARPKPGEAES